MSKNDLEGSFLAAAIGAGVGYWNARKGLETLKAMEQGQQSRESLESVKQQAWLIPVIYAAVGQGLKSGMGQDAAGNAFLAMGAAGLASYWLLAPVLDKQIATAPSSTPAPAVNPGAAGYSMLGGAGALNGRLFPAGRVGVGDPATALLLKQI